jgi:hypothetical protein
VSTLPILISSIIFTMILRVSASSRSEEGNPHAITKPVFESAIFTTSGQMLGNLRAM